MADSTARAAARARLSLMVASTARPVLDDAALDVLLDGSRVRDTHGIHPSETGWTETWDLNSAAAEGWRFKAGIVAGDYSFSADDASYDRGALLASMESMVSMYLAKVSGSTQTVATTDYSNREYDWTGLIP